MTKMAPLPFPPCISLLLLLFICCCCAQMLFVVLLNCCRCCCCCAQLLLLLLLCSIVVVVVLNCCCCCRHFLLIFVVVVSQSVSQSVFQSDHSRMTYSTRRYLSGTHLGTCVLAAIRCTVSIESNTIANRMYNCLE